MDQSVLLCGQIEGAFSLIVYDESGGSKKWVGVKTPVFSQVGDIFSICNTG